jgi:hypothetical protein
MEQAVAVIRKSPFQLLATPDRKHERQLSFLGSVLAASGAKPNPGVIFSQDGKVTHFPFAMSPLQRL